MILPHLSSLGDQFFYNRDKYHRDGGPAAIFHNGYQEWRQDDKLNRENHPAVLYPDGHMEWYMNDQII